MCLILQMDNTKNTCWQLKETEVLSFYRKSTLRRLQVALPIDSVFLAVRLFSAGKLEHDEAHSVGSKKIQSMLFNHFHLS